MSLFSKIYTNVPKYVLISGRVASTSEKQIAPNSFVLCSNITRTEYAMSQRYN